jgi:hypothetical protein
MTAVEEFLAQLSQTDFAITATEAAEALWLAGHIVSAQDLAIQPARPFTRATSARDPGVSPQRPHQDSAGDQPTGSTIPLSHPGTLSPGQQSSSHDVLPIQLRDLPEVSETLDLQRALRPLKRTVRAGPAKLLDEEATVMRSAMAWAVLPSWSRSTERWLSLAIVVDTSPSMILWDKLAAELHTLMAQLGAFRTIRTWRLRFDVHTRDGLAVISPAGSAATARDPRELVDPTGRQAILVITDCVAETWAGDAPAMKTLKTWASTGPLAILQPLSQEMWRRSAAECHRVRLRAPYPGAANHLLIPDNGAGDPAGVPVPMLEISRDWFESWSRLISGAGTVRSVVTYAGAPRPTQPAESAKQPSPPSGDDPEQVVRRFMAAASPEAFKLAGLLAGTPLTLPMMRYIQQAMLPHSRPPQLAEVYLSGLLRLAPPLPGQPSPAPVRFEFRPDVEDVLRRTVRRSEAIRVMNLVTAELSSGPLGATEGFRANLALPPGTTGRAMPVWDKIFAAVASSIPYRLGGRYRTAAGTAGSAAAVRTGVGPPLAGPATVPAGEAQSSEWELGRRFQSSGSGLSIAMLGPAGSGKTTFLAALGISLARTRYERSKELWTIVGEDAVSTSALIEMTEQLVNRSFPEATQGIDYLHWRLYGRVPVVERRRLVRRHREETVTIGLDIADAAADLGAGPMAELLDALLNSRGIVFVLDPAREIQVGDAFSYCWRIVAGMASRRSASERPLDRLPHFVAVCISKFDDIRVFRSAQALNLVDIDPDDPHGFPRVDDDDARDFLRHLCEMSPSGTAELVMQTLETYFRPERVKYFVNSSIGFYVDAYSDGFDPDDFVNCLPDQNADRKERIRGPINPINVLEPILWLSKQIAASSD